MNQVRLRHTSRPLERPQDAARAPSTPWGGFGQVGRLGLRGAILGAVLLLGGCASQPPSGARPGVAASSDDPSDAAKASADAAQTDLPSSAQRPSIGQDVATRHALFKVSAFESLPGWQQDNLGEAWTAFRESCKSLERKPNWKPLCTKVKAIRDPKAGRAFLEGEFALLVVQNTDRTREGEITGYYEPLLQGRAQRDARFSVPVYGVPNDLYILDWKTVPAAQRKGLTHVRAVGRQLVPALAGQSGAVRIDLRRFTLDTLDRRLRVKIQRGAQGEEAVPYPSRADIGRQASLDAPVLAWVDDPVALYAMQIQGAGRIRMADGSVLRLAYADQNGHPFKPMQLAAHGNERVQTRGAPGEGSEDADIEQFELAGVTDVEALGGASAAADASLDGDLVTRGGRKPAAGGAAASVASESDVSAAVDALTPKPGARPVAGAAAARQAGATVAVGAGKAAAASPAPANQLVDDLLAQAKPRDRRSAGNAAAAKAAQAPLASSGKAGQKPTNTATVAGASASLMSTRQRALESDPSFVFFRVATDQTSDAGPVGALGVPLTPGRSLAVDPRVLPLGYPVFLDAATGNKREPHMQRLMFAQDTGGAIRGAVRADYFWGFGADAGKQARRTKQKGRMWVMVPHAEVQALLSSKLVTRGKAAAPDELPECLIEDGMSCEDIPPDEAP